MSDTEKGKSSKWQRHLMVSRRTGLRSGTEAEGHLPKTEEQKQDTQTEAAEGAEAPEDGAQATEEGAQALEKKNEEAPRRQSSRPASRLSHGSSRRPTSQVSCSTAVSRASVEAHLTAKMKILRVRQMEKRIEIERQEDA